MTQKTITMQVTDDEAVLDSAVDSIAKASGWTEESEVTQLETVRKLIMIYLGNVAKSYNANQAAEQARQEAISQTEQAISNITSTLTIK